MKISFTAFSCLAFSLTMGCGRQLPRTESQVKVSVPLPASEFDAIRIQSMLLRLQEVAELGHGDIAVSDVLSLIPLPPAEIARVNQTYLNHPINFSCQDGRCRGSASSDLNAPLAVNSTISVAGIQGGRITIQPMVSVYFRFINATTLELCRIEGIKVKPNAFLSPTVTVNGAYLVMKDTNPAGISEIKVDAGPLGTYPSADCNP